MHVVKAKAKRMTGLEFMSVNDETVEVRYVPARFQSYVSEERIPPWDDPDGYWRSMMIHPKCMDEFTKLIGSDFVVTQSDLDRSGFDESDDESGSY